MSVWHNVKRYAQAVVSDEEMENARKLTLAQVREMSQKQIQKAKDFYTDSSHITWWEGPLPSHLHWKPFRDVIENAEMNFANAEKEPEQDRQKTLYLLAWRTARIAVDSIAKEAKKDRTYWEVLAEPTITKVVSEYNDTKNQIKDTTGTVITVVVALAIVFVLVESRK